MAIGQRLATPVTQYLILTSAPILIYFVLCLFSTSTGPLVVIIFTMIGASFWVTKNILGMQMVGLRWSVDILEDRTVKFSYEKRPDPYMPNQNDSNVFWIGFFMSVVSWIFFSIIFLFVRGFGQFFVAFVAFLVQGTQLLMYMKAYSESQRQNESDIYPLTEGTGVRFEYIDEEEVGDTEKVVDSSIEVSA